MLKNTQHLKARWKFSDSPGLKASPSSSTGLCLDVDTRKTRWNPDGKRLIWIVLFWGWKTIRWNTVFHYPSHILLVFLFWGWKCWLLTGIPDSWDAALLHSLLEKFTIGLAVESSQATKKVVTILVFFHIKNTSFHIKKQSARSLLKICQPQWSTSTLHKYIQSQHLSTKTTQVCFMWAMKKSLLLSIILVVWYGSL